MTSYSSTVGSSAPERKTTAAALASYLFGLGLLAVLNWTTKTNLLGSLPDGVEVFLDPIIPALAALVGGYVTRHRPGALSPSALEAARGGPVA